MTVKEPAQYIITEAEIADINREAQDQAISGQSPAVFLAREIERRVSQYYSEQASLSEDVRRKLEAQNESLRLTASTESGRAKDWRDKLYEVSASISADELNRSMDAWGAAGFVVTDRAANFLNYFLADRLAKYEPRDHVCAPIFEVQVGVMKEAHQTTYHVMLTNQALRKPTFTVMDTEGCMTPFVTEVREHAVSEAEDWADFLGVPYVITGLDSDT